MSDDLDNNPAAPEGAGENATNGTGKRPPPEPLRRFMTDPARAEERRLKSRKAAQASHGALPAALRRGLRKLEKLKEVSLEAPAALRTLEIGTAEGRLAVRKALGVALLNGHLSEKTCETLARLLDGAARDDAAAEGGAAIIAWLENEPPVSAPVPPPAPGPEANLDPARALTEGRTEWLPPLPPFRPERKISPWVHASTGGVCPGKRCPCQSAEE